MNRAWSHHQLPSATELAHAPELAILIALDALLEMTTVSIHLALPELELLQRAPELLDPDLDDRDMALAHDILGLIHTLRNTLQIYKQHALRP